MPYSQRSKVLLGSLHLAYNQKNWVMVLILGEGAPVQVSQSTVQLKLPQSLDSPEAATRPERGGPDS